MTARSLQRRIGLAAALLPVAAWLACTGPAKPKPGADAAKAAAMRSCEARRDAHCIEKLREAEALARRDAELVHHRGWAHLQLGEYDEALAAADRTLKLDPSEYRAHALQAKAHLASEEPEEAIRAYEALLVQRPNDIESLGVIATLHARAERWDDCLAFATRTEQALSVQPVDRMPLALQRNAVQTWLLRSECAHHRDAGPSAPRAAQRALEARMRERGQLTTRPEQFAGLSPEEQAAAHRVAARLLSADPRSKLVGQQFLFGLAVGGYLPAVADRGVLAMKAAHRPGNREDALGWFRIGAREGDPVAQVNLGALLWAKPENTADREEAFRLFTESAEQDNRLAFFYLGVTHRDGVQGKRDPAAADRWFRRARDAGFDIAAAQAAGLPVLDSYELSPAPWP